MSYHTSLRDKKALISVLDKVKGIGKAKRLCLTKKFGDVGGIIKATKEEIATTKGIGEKLAQEIIDKLIEEGLK